MPEWTNELRPRLASLRLSPAREAEIIEELSAHLDQRYEALRAGGVSDPAARQVAVDELLEQDALARFMRPLRQANVPPPIVPGAPRRRVATDIWQDLRYAVRMLRRAPTFTVAAVLTIALGIGANSAMFALVDTVLLRPLPIRDPGQAVVLWETTPTNRRGGVSPLNLRDWEQRSRSFERMAGFMPYVGSMVMGGMSDIAETIPRQWVSSGFFDTLGATMVAGRGFLASEERDRADVIVISEGFWRSRFNADPAMIGRQLRLDGDPYTIVGVAPDSAQVFGQTSIWGLVSFEGAPPRFRGVYLFRAFGRLKPGVTRQAAEADLASIAEALGREYPTTNNGRGAAVEPLGDVVFGSDLRQTSLLFLGVVAFVLLICCGNVANLLLARGTARTRELAIRSALGADRVRVVRQLLTESLVLAIVGGAVGLGVGALVLEATPSFLPEGLLPPAVSLTFDVRVVGFCVVLALAVGIVFGLAPALQATRLTPARALSGDVRTATRGGGRTRTFLVAAEVATAVVLLVGAGLLLRTLIVVDNVDRGYGAGDMLTAVIDPHGSQYPAGPKLVQFYEDVERETRALPVVRDMAWASTLPLGPSEAGDVTFAIVGAAAPPESQRPSADYQIVSAGYFKALDLPLVAGRPFDGRDIADGAPTCIVNEAFARRYLAGQSPIGARISIQVGPPSEPPVVREVVGVARQVKGRADETQEFVQIYVPLAQDPIGDIFMLVRPAAGDANALAPAIRAAIGRVDTKQLVSVRGVMTLDDVSWSATSRYRFRAVLVAAFAGLALLLAAVGLFGTIAYTVQQRTREFGLRRALGATSGDVLRSLIRSALGMIAGGALAGLVLAIALARLMTALLFGVAPLDPLTLVIVPLVLGVTGMIAIAGPAWRAAQIDPAIALRDEN